MTQKRNERLPLSSRRRARPRPSGSGFDDSAALAELRSAVLSLPYPALCRLVGDLLLSLGYADVRPAGRAGARGRNRDGGLDLGATVRGGLGRRRVAVQVRQYAPGALVHRRQLDELLGACVRLGCSEGVLVTTGAFSGPAAEWARELARLDRPPGPALHLIDGDALVELLTACRVGVRVAPGDGGPVPDSAYFKGLTVAAAPARPCPTTVSEAIGQRLPRP
jgi:hypothetical protein